MKAHIATINGEIDDQCYASLKELCENVGINYSTATKGKTVYIKTDGSVVRLYPVTFNRIKRSAAKNGNASNQNI